ncbi:MAG: gliding motility-associated C-terminal domain-containing protein, partial [Methanosarcinales archaeon]|nr:gliding motility-associated C-terminal domain-containing protein [Methanosarcinales archaeon]
TILYVNGCDSIIYDVTIIVDSFENVVIDTTICQGVPFIINGVTYSTNQVNTLDTAYYSQSGCDSIHYDITINIDSSENVIVDTAICQGQSVMVNGMNYTSNQVNTLDTAFYSFSACDSILYTINIVVNPTFDDTAVINICANETYTMPDATIVSSTGIYYFPDTTINGCDSLYTVDLTVNPLPITNVNIGICLGDSVFLENAWQNSAGVYTDTVVMASPICDSIIITTLTINPIPVVVANANNTNLCQGETLILFGSGATSFIWTNSVVNNVGFIPSLGASTYVVTGTDANSCTSTDTIDVMVNATFSSIENITICEDALPFVFHDGSSYNSNSSTSHISNLITVNNCDSLITTNLTINNLGVFSTIPDTIKVCDNFYQEIEMNNQNMTSVQWQLNSGTGFNNLIDTGIYSGTASNKLTISSLDVSLDGNMYRVVMFDECGYGPFMDTTILKVAEPHDVANPIDDVVRCLRDSSLIVIDYNGYNYVWNNGQTGPHLIVNGSGTYTVNFLENGTDCKMDDEFEVEINDCVANCVVLAPTGFSPNESNSNDLFRVMTSCDEGFSFFEFKVFNRWGEMVYTTNNPTDGWDGEYKNGKAEIGVYAYTVDFIKNGITKKEKLIGQVTLIR